MFTDNPTTHRLRTALSSLMLFQVLLSLVSAAVAMVSLSPFISGDCGADILESFRLIHLATGHVMPTVILPVLLMATLLFSLFYCHALSAGSASGPVKWTGVEGNSVFRDLQNNFLKALFIHMICD